MDLAHGQAPARQPGAVEVAEPRVAVAVGVPLQVFEVQQLQGDTGPPALGVDPGAVERRALPLARDLRPAIEPALQGLVRQRLDLRPVQPGGVGPTHDAADRAQPDPEAARHGSVAEPQGPLLSQNFADLPHGQSLGRHRTPFVCGGRRRAGPSSVACSGARPPFGGRIACPAFTITDLRVHHPDLGVHHERSGCSRCTDPSVHDRPIRAFTFDRHAQLAEPTDGRPSIFPLCVSQSSALDSSSRDTGGPGELGTMANPKPGEAG